MALDEQSYHGTEAIAVQSSLVLPCLGGSFFGGRIKPLRQGLKGITGSLAGLGHIDRRIRAERQFARVASISVAHGPGLRAGGLNDEIQPGQTRIRNLAAHRPWFQLFDGLGGEQLGHISEPLG